jgi:membrane peptidoglycan carboxypeptidase
MSPFRRNGRDENSPGDGAEGNEAARGADTGRPTPSVDDQWFRPDPPSTPPATGAEGRRYKGPNAAADAKAAKKAQKDAQKSAQRDAKVARKAGKNGPAAAGAMPAMSDDYPTEGFAPPANWLDDTAGSAAVGAGGAGAASAAAAGAAAGAGGAGTGDGTGGVAVLDQPKPKKPKKKRHLIQKSLWTMLVLFTIGFGVVLVAYSRIEIPDAANANATRQTSRVYYAGGQEEIGRFGDINRNSVTLDKVPMDLRNAVLAAENRNFYNDNGVSPKGMLRALWVNLKGGSGSAQGGSTITQQYVKNYYLTQDKTIKRKLREALLSIKIDREKSKDQILQDYLNTIYMGRGAYGVQSAAKAYFDKDVSKINTGEAAVLASIIRSPGRYDPADPDTLANLKVRWRYVVDAMAQIGTLTPEQAKSVKFPKFPEQIKAQSRYGGQKGYILTAVRNELMARGLSKDEIENGGLRIVTTLDPQAQQAALDAVNKEFPTIKNEGLRVGLAAVQPGTGRIIAMYGGKDFLGKSKYAQVNTAMVPIQPGSSMKVFTLAAALEKGYSLNSGFYGNSPLSLPGSKPVNNEFNQDYGSSVSLMKGLEDSVNTVFVDATMKVGASNVRKAIVRAGIPNDAPGLDTNARITLGIASIRATQLADAYATMCAGGIHAEQHLVERVYRPNGGEFPIRKPDISERPVFEPWIVSDVIKAMRNVVDNGTGTRAKKLGRPAAGKTGTHEDLTAWFTGCTPQLATSVVFFKGDGTKSLDGTGGMETFFGGTYPAQTWTTFMKAALRGQPVKTFPVVRKEGEVRQTQTADPYDSFDGFQGTNPTVQPTEQGTDAGPMFPSFDPGPNTFSPAPSPAPPVETAEPEPTAAPLPENCTNNAADPDETRVFRTDCPYSSVDDPNVAPGTESTSPPEEEGEPPPQASGDEGRSVRVPGPGTPPGAHQ